MRRWRDLAPLLLALVLALTACAPGGRREARKIDWTGSPAYLAEEIPLPVETGDLIGCCTDGENMYVLADRRTEDGQVRSVLFRVDLARGTAAELEDYQGPETPEDAVLNRFGPVLAPDGTLWVYEPWSVRLYDLPEDFGGTEEDKAAYVTGIEEFHHLRQLDPVTGREKKLVDLSAAAIALAEEEGGFSIASFTVDAGGLIYFARSGGVAALDQRGDLQFTLQADLPWNAVYNAAGGSLVLLPDGTAAVLTVRPGGRREVRSIDPAAKDWGGLRCELPGTDMLYGGAGGFQFFYTSGGTLYGWPEGGREPQALLDWSALHLEGGVLCFAPLDGGKLAALSLSPDPDAPGDWYAYSLRLAVCSPTDEPPEDGRATLVYGCLLEHDWDLSALQAHINKVNRRSEDCYIEIRNYGGAGEAAGLARLSADVMSGRCPDLWDESLPIDLYARKGYLEDLWPWIDGDGELGGRDALMRRVLEAASVDGKLYKVCRSFAIQTLVGCADVVGGRTGWTMEELLECWRSLPEGSPLLNTRNNNSLSGLDVFLTMNEDRWVDWSTGTCYFDTEEFRSVLELCAEMGDGSQWKQTEGYGDADPDGGEALRAGRQLVTAARIADYPDILYYEALCAGPEALFDRKAMLDEIGVVGSLYRGGKLIYPDAPAVYPCLGQEEDARETGTLFGFPLSNDVRFGSLEDGGCASYIGYPTPEGSGSLFQLENCAAMSASCAHKEGAWDLLRSMLLPGGNDAILEGSRLYGFQSFPINKADLDARMRPEISWLTSLSGGEYLLDPDGDRIALPVRNKDSQVLSSRTVYEPLIRVGYPVRMAVYPMPLGEAQYENFMRLYNAATRAASGDGVLRDLVLEQAQVYFAGDKSLEDTAALIQSRATIYVNENR